MKTKYAAVWVVSVLALAACGDLEVNGTGPEAPTEDASPSPGPRTPGMPAPSADAGRGDARDDAGGYPADAAVLHDAASLDAWMGPPPDEGNGSGKGRGP